MANAIAVDTLNDHIFLSLRARKKTFHLNFCVFEHFFCQTDLKTIKLFCAFKENYFFFLDVYCNMQFSHKNARNLAKGIFCSYVMIKRDYPVFSVTPGVSDITR